MGIRKFLRRRRQNIQNDPNRRKLIQGIQEIFALSDEDLRDEAVLVEIIRRVGLRNDPRGLYGDETPFMNGAGEGLHQLPRQLAKAMTVLSRQEIGSFLEVGTHSGYTASILTAYLSRLNPDLRALTIDPSQHFWVYGKIRPLIPLEYRNCTSEDLRGEKFDLVFIGGDHSYQGVRRDFENVGKVARVCMFHDINDEFVGFDTVPLFWSELVESDRFAEVHEILDCAPGRKIMGIGIVVA